MAIAEIAMLASAVRELHQLRAERQERAALWPQEDSAENNDAVIAGQIREQMNLARRVAKTNVNVLITGKATIAFAVRTR